jgi:cytochrome o ubiquinol oxidase subunit 2
MNARVQYLFLLLMVAGCTPDNISFLNPQGPIAAAQRWHFVLVSALVMLVVLPVLVLTPLVAWRYRRRNQKARYTPKWDFSIAGRIRDLGHPCGHRRGSRGASVAQHRRTRPLFTA